MLKCKAEMTRTVLPENSCTECCSCIYVKLPQYQLSCGEDSCLNVGAFDRTADVQLLPQFLCSGFVTIPLSPCRGKKVRFFFFFTQLIPSNSERNLSGGLVALLPAALYIVGM